VTGKDFKRKEWRREDGEKQSAQKFLGGQTQFGKIFLGGRMQFGWKFLGGQ
jgi:hypothetical protein